MNVDDVSYEVKNHPLICAEWDVYLSHCSRTNLEEGRWNSKLIDPIDGRSQLLNGPNPNAYKTLSECLLSQFIIFNRRQDEVVKILTYRNRPMQEVNVDIIQCVSKLRTGFKSDIYQVS